MRKIRPRGATESQSRNSNINRIRRIVCALTAVEKKEWRNKDEEKDRIHPKRKSFCVQDISRNLRTLNHQDIDQKKIYPNGLFLVSETWLWSATGIFDKLAPKTSMKMLHMTQQKQTFLELKFLSSFDKLALKTSIKMLHMTQ